VDVDIYEYELPWVREGMAAEMDLSYIPGKRFYGKVVYIYPYLESKTRTAKLRLKFPNPNYKLKLDMYATVYLKSTVAKNSLVIPQEAVIDSGVRKVVFVALGKGKFQPREVKLGLEGNDNEFQVLEGLKEGEEIVVSAQFMLDSESRLREAIQKMLEVRQTSSPDKQAAEKIAEGESHSKADDLDMSGMTMEDSPQKPSSHQQ
jgi:Cu(I)/Ag(I) efflux system membrane fusion protein/cobalt-zinc-cadmium efflux system membrane fusion protein